MAATTAPRSATLPDGGEAAASLAAGTPMVPTEREWWQVRAFFKAKRWKVITFLGYSGAEYEDPTAMLKHAGRTLDRLTPSRTVVNIGATTQGIGAVYEVAKRRGFTTTSKSD